MGRAEILQELINYSNSIDYIGLSIGEIINLHTSPWYPLTSISFLSPLPSRWLALDEESTDLHPNTPVSSRGFRTYFLWEIKIRLQIKQLQSQESITGFQSP